MAITTNRTTLSGIYRSSVIDYNADYSVSFWFRNTEATNDTYQTALAITYSGSSAIYDNWLQYSRAGAHDIIIETDGGASGYKYVSLYTGNPLPTGWHFLCGYRSGTSMYASYDFKSFVSTDGGSVGSRTAADRLSIGYFATSTEGAVTRWAGNIANVKIWNTALSRSELFNEGRSRAPQRYKNLWCWLPMFPTSTSEVLRDYSGNRRDFTNTSTAVGIDPPMRYKTSGLILPEYHWESSATDWCEFQFSSLTDPSTDSGHILHVRRYKSGTATIKHVYAIVQGSTVIQEFEDSSIPEGASDATFTITNASAISSYSDLRCRVRAIKVS